MLIRPTIYVPSVTQHTRERFNNAFRAWVVS